MDPAEADSGVGIQDIAGIGDATNSAAAAAAEYDAQPVPIELDFVDRVGAELAGPSRAGEIAGEWLVARESSASTESIREAGRLIEMTVPQRVLVIDLI